MSYDPGGCIRTPFAVPKVVDASAGACAELALALGGVTVPFAFELNGVNGTERKRVSGTGTKDRKRMLDSQQVMDKFGIKVDVVRTLPAVPFAWLPST